MHLDAYINVFHILGSSSHDASVCLVILPEAPAARVRIVKAVDHAGKSWRWLPPKPKVSRQRQCMSSREHCINTINSTFSRAQRPHHIATRKEWRANLLRIRS